MRLFSRCVTSFINKVNQLEWNVVCRKSLICFVFHKWITTKKVNEYLQTMPYTFWVGVACIQFSANTWKTVTVFPLSPSPHPHTSNLWQNKHKIKYSILKNSLTSNETVRILTFSKFSQSHKAGLPSRFGDFESP